MPFKYSENLRDRLKAYFNERYDLVISDEEADLWLDSMASLFDAFSPP